MVGSPRHVRKVPTTDIVGQIERRSFSAKCGSVTHPHEADQCPL